MKEEEGVLLSDGMGKYPNLGFRGEIWVDLAR